MSLSLIDLCGFCKVVSVVHHHTVVLCMFLKFQCVLGPGFHVFQSLSKLFIDTWDDYVSSLGYLEGVTDS